MTIKLLNDSNKVLVNNKHVRTVKISIDDKQYIIFNKKESL